MTFVRTTWQPGRAGGTPIGSADLNRIEQGVSDLFAYRGTPKVVDFDTGGSTTLAVTGLDGATHRGYDVWLEALYKVTSGECAPYFRSNPSPAGARCFYRGAYMNGGAITTDDSTSRSGVGITMGQTYQQATARNRLLLTGRLLCSTPAAGSERVLFNGSFIARGNLGGADTTFRAGDIHGWMNMTVNLTALDFEFDNAAAAGRLILTPIVGSF